MKRFLVFYEDSRKASFTLPATDGDIYDFCLAVGRTKQTQESAGVLSATLAKYLYALQAWHVFHQKPYPKDSQDVVKVLLRASANADAEAPTRPRKSAVMIHHLLVLYDTLNGGSPKDESILDCAVCAFWGMARWQS